MSKQTSHDNDQPLQYRRSAYNMHSSTGIMWKVALVICAALAATILGNFLKP